jgi:hypothetical protein
MAAVAAAVLFCSGSQENLERRKIQLKFAKYKCQAAAKLFAGELLALNEELASAPDHSQANGGG